MMAAPTNVEITIITITEVPTAPSSSNNKLEFVVPSGRTSSNSVTCKIYTSYILMIIIMTIILKNSYDKLYMTSY